MSNPLNPGFRSPPNIPSDAAHESVRKAIKDQSNGIVDLNQAVVALSSRIGSVETTQATSGSSSTTTATEVVTNIVNNIGTVNNQSGVTAYTTQQNDDGALIVLSDASAIAVTLNFSVTTPWFTTLSNAGAGTVTVTPQQGLINGNATLTLPGGSWVTIYFDGSNWWADAPGATAGGVTQIVAGTNVTISPTSGVGVVTVNASGGGGYSLGGTVTSANLVFGPGAGTGATLSGIAGLDGNHHVSFQTGSSPSANAIIYTLTFTTPRPNPTYPVVSSVFGSAYSSANQIPYGVGASTTVYYVYSNQTALAASTVYDLNISCP